MIKLTLGKSLIFVIESFLHASITFRRHVLSYSIYFLSRRCH